MLTHDARHVDYFKTQEGQESSLAELELAWKWNQMLHTTFGETTKTQLPST